MKHNFRIYVRVLLFGLTCCQEHLHYLTFQSLDYERTW
jgi:hypothetical protein